MSLPVFPKSLDFRFAALHTPRRVWAIPSVHGELNRLTAMHNNLIERVKPGDRIIYLGNYIGHGPDSAGVIDELLSFRRMALAIAGFQPSDLVYLRGSQEEILQRVLQLHFASEPAEVLSWMLDQGIDSTLESYGVDVQEGMVASTSTPARLARWTNFVRHMINRRNAHDIFFSQLKRAAYTSNTDNSNDPSLLFVNAGINIDRRLEDQGDRFWWGGDDFSTITEAYRPFSRVIRGYDPSRKGLYINCVTATLDNNCGFGGSLACASWMPDASVGDIFRIVIRNPLISRL